LCATDTLVKMSVIPEPATAPPDQAMSSASQTAMLGEICVAGRPDEGSRQGAKPPLSRGKRALFLAAPFAAFVCLLGAIEGFVRLRLPQLESLAVFVRQPALQDDFGDREQVRIFEGDPRLGWRLKPNLDQVIWDFTLISTNGQGIRHPRPLGPKPSGTWRIVCLGDSVTFGFRVPVVFPENPTGYSPDWLPYPMLLETALRAANPDRAPEVVDLAVPGYTSHQGLAWLRRDIAWLAPDLVTLCFGWNDISLRPPPDAEALPQGALGVWGRSLVARSQTLLRLSLWLRTRREAAKPPPAGLPPSRVALGAYVANILEMAALARRHGAAVVVIGPVYRDSVSNPAEAARMMRYRAALRAAAGRQGLPYLEVPELTESAHPANAGLFGELIHPNHLGHRLLAARLARFVSSQGLLADLRVPAAEDPNLP
jgi:lysophospholipase L1-like esterase